MAIPIYNSFDEKSMNFRVTQINSIEQFIQLREQHQESKGIYRGLSSSKYQIYSSLQRETLLSKVESFNLNEYAKIARANPLLKKYFKTFNIQPTKLSVFSYLQHYGAPTPFIDFTSAFVLLFSLLQMGKRIFP